MTAFQAVQYVGGALSLVAFVVAAFLYAYRARLRNHIQIIQSAPETDRLEAIATAAEFFRVDVSQLSAAQRYSIVLEQLHIRSRRDWLLFSFAIVFALVCATFALIATAYVPNPGPVVHDLPATKPESPATRVNAFTVRVPTGVPGESEPHRWVRTGGNWEERVVDGRTMLHKIDGRMSLNSCDGTRTKKEEDLALQFFIPDVGCAGMIMMFRRDRNPWTAWLPMLNINPTN
jgi:hypothetical protein